MLSKFLLSLTLVLLTVLVGVGLYAKSLVSEVAALEQREVVYKQSVASLEKTISEIKSEALKTVELYEFASRAKAESDAYVAKMMKSLRRQIDEDPTVKTWSVGRVPAAFADELRRAARRANLQGREGESSEGLSTGH